jgi:hypothetical protein
LCKIIFLTLRIEKNKSNRESRVDVLKEITKQETLK